MQNYNRLTVDLSAIETNLQTIASHFPNTRLMTMVKASAYGTDELVLADFYHSTCGISIVGVSHVQEGVSLRIKGFKGDIFVIGASILEVSTIVEYNLEVAVDNFEFCLALQQEALKQKSFVKVHLHLDTGMKRFGCNFDEAPALAEKIAQMPNVKLEGIMTHFIGAESIQYDTISHEQVNLLEKLLLLLRTKGIVPSWVHAANSSGVLRFRSPFCNLVRIGLAAFGLYSSREEKSNFPLCPSLTLETIIMGINKCRKGDCVGYLQEYKVQNEQERIAILPIGYHDGLHLRYSGKGYVLIHGKKAPMVGRICMDFMMVNITDIPEARIGDAALIFGKNQQGHYLPTEKVAQWGGTNVRELIACLGPRVERQFVYSKGIYDTSSERIRSSFCSF